MNRHEFIKDMARTETSDISCILSDANNLIDMCLDTYGIKNELTVCIEELSELEKEITKILRCDISEDSENDEILKIGILEELSDVIIMCIALTKMYFEPDDVIRAIKVKLNHQKKRFENLL